MELLTSSGDARTAAFWRLGNSSDSPNWIAKWFLYHKFRYRDGRNRARDAEKGAKKPRSSGSDSKGAKTKMKAPPLQRATQMGAAAAGVSVSASGSPSAGRSSE
jgi:hypothetical protein